jgi:hypothetical protein
MCACWPILFCLAVCVPLFAAWTVGMHAPNLSVSDSSVRGVPSLTAGCREEGVIPPLKSRFSSCLDCALLSHPGVLNPYV